MALSLKDRVQPNREDPRASIPHIGLLGLGFQGKNLFLYLSSLILYEYLSTLSLFGGFSTSYNSSDYPFFSPFGHCSFLSIPFSPFCPGIFTFLSSFTFIDSAQLTGPKILQNYANHSTERYVLMTDLKS